MHKLRILVLGDEQVGKTSIIRCFLTQSFPTEVPTCNPPISIPNELSLSNCSLTIIDSLCKTYIDRKGQETYSIQREISKSSIIILVFDITRPDSLKRILNFWLPLIKSQSETPCILVGNKIDLPKSSQNLEEILKEITSEYPQCQIAIETTAKSYTSIAKVFQIAEQAVVYPTNKLYNPITYELTEEFLRALKLIFRLCDQDGDMRLNNRELEKFNNEVFQLPLSLKELEKIKHLVKENCSDGVDHIGVTLQGFIAINKIFIKKLKSNNSWKMLKYFDFNEDLQRTISVDVAIESGKSIELSFQSIDFLQIIYKKYSTHDLLTENGINEIFSTVKTKPWEPNCYQEMVPSIDGGISLHSWIALWQLLLFNNPNNAMACLINLGYSHAIATAYEKPLISSLSHRKLLVCSVVGMTSVGKKQLLRKFLNRDLGEKVLNCVCGSIEEAESIFEGKYLILSKTSEILNDVVCMVYDGSSASMNFIKKIVIDEKKPRILLLNKNDMAEHDSAYSFSLELGLRECPQFCLKTQRPNSLYKLIKDYATQPQKGSIRRGKIVSQPKKSGFFYAWTIAMVGMASVAVYIGRKGLAK